MSPKLSVIVPCYNSASTIARTLGSLFGQLPGNELEIIAVNDGSSDGTATILDRSAAQHAQLKVIHRPNGGVSAARNTGLDAAEGEYIAFCDSDDVYLPDYASVMLGMLEKDKNAGIAVCGYTCSSPSGLSGGTAGPSAEQNFSRDEGLALLMRGGTLGWSLWNKVYRRSVIGDLRFDETVRRTSEDALFNTAAFIRLGSMHCRTSARALYDYTVQSGASLTSAQSAEKLHETVSVSEKIAALVSEQVPRLSKQAADMRTRTSVSLACLAYRTGSDMLPGAGSELSGICRSLRSHFLRNLINPRLGLKYYAANLILCACPPLYRKMCRRS